VTARVTGCACVFCQVCSVYARHSPKLREVVARSHPPAAPHRAPLASFARLCGARQHDLRPRPVRQGNGLAAAARHNGRADERAGCVCSWSPAPDGHARLLQQQPFACPVRDPDRRHGHRRHGPAQRGGWMETLPAASCRPQAAKTSRAGHWVCAVLARPNAPDPISLLAACLVARPRRHARS
jgi:hypothetical protein